ncbi:S8 family peptidase [Texcoconibacillus texcoconensis]|uniref:Peptidase S8/S53 domain-containing protein n=1 Tax=Texcoconibacillus texcoconensis TaxID=1095777 RepID=A0A840QQN4_9BACI|nr:S8 family peptidase [Texcoconibacillus texcoconensis]MBB5173641.1 hypothetical protein [Texcoconibacillus texcoconensis]
MERLIKLSIFYAVSLFAVLAIWFTSSHEIAQDDEETGVGIEAMNQILAEDVSLSISMFLHQVASDLEPWLEEGEEEELTSWLADHPFIEGMALFSDDQVVWEYGTIESDAKDQIEPFDEYLFLSDPYERNGKDHLLVGRQKEEEVIVGELDLSFVEHFAQDLGHVMDQQQQFVAGGDDVDVKTLTEDERVGSMAYGNVPELNWEVIIDQHENQEEATHFIEHEAVVKLTEIANEMEWLKQQNVKKVDDHDPYIVVRDESQPTDSFVKSLQQDEEIEWAEPNYLYHKQQNDNETFRDQFSLPNDEFYAPYQWNLHQIDMEEQGWELDEEEMNDVSIAIIDSGVDPDHPDLEEKLTAGYNAFTHDSTFHDENGHGTHVAGVATAITNNVEGIAGVGWENPLLAVKVLDEQAEGDAMSIADGIRWAVDEGAEVINLSLGDHHDSEVLHDAIRYAYDNDVVLIAATGNENVSTPMYPAAYEEVLAVSAVDINDKKAIFSNYGNHVDVTAPGEHIPSTFLNKQYMMMSGTSMASPHVAGLAGVIRIKDSSLNNEEIYDIIRESSDDLGRVGRDPYYGYGKINIKNALERLEKTD